MICYPCGLVFKTVCVFYNVSIELYLSVLVVLLLLNCFYIQFVVCPHLILLSTTCGKATDVEIVQDSSCKI